MRESRLLWEYSCAFVSPHYFNNLHCMKIYFFEKSKSIFVAVQVFEIRVFSNAHRYQ